MREESKTRAILTLFTDNGPLLQKFLDEPFEGTRLYETLTADRSFNETGFRVKYVDSRMDYSKSTVGTCVSEWKGLIEQDINSSLMEGLLLDCWKLINLPEAIERLPFLPDLMRSLIDDVNWEFEKESDFLVPRPVEVD